MNLTQMHTDQSRMFFDIDSVFDTSCFYLQKSVCICVKNFFDKFNLSIYINKVNLLLLLLLSFVFVSYSQENPIDESKTITFIDKYSFGDKKAGIPKLVKAYDTLERSDCFPSSQSEENYEKQLKIIVEPVLKEIFTSIKTFENKYNLIILDGPELEAKGQLLWIDDKLNITKQFIEYFNNYQNPNEPLKYSFPQRKILTINTNKFSDTENGLKGFSQSVDCSKTKLCSKIAEAIISFGKRNEYGFILDSSKDLPKEISKFQTTDITQQFISEFNKNN